MARLRNFAPNDNLHTAQTAVMCHLAAILPALLLPATLDSWLTARVGDHEAEAGG